MRTIDPAQVFSLPEQPQIVNSAVTRFESLSSAVDTIMRFIVPINTSGVVRLMVSGSARFEEVAAMRVMTLAYRNSEGAGLSILNNAVDFEYTDDAMTDIVINAVVDGSNLAITVEGVDKDINWASSYSFLYSVYEYIAP